ncbi:serine/threonine-protein kinase DCLK3 [Sphaeramia orbicularis]|uniref:serine/threonine-protein kinase DCLK3 n=1 Tax=Sphaeramia orbicularis TaxID=375764 RepID=UPI00117C51C9|nr:serine/threonine-protein kinase DCLK3 [Sphaeramia orbicularis]
MTPSQKARYGCEPARKWRAAVPPPPPLLKRAAGVTQPWPVHPQPAGGHGHRSHYHPPIPPAPLPPPQLPLFHTRHAEESAERPRLVTIVRPCGQSTMRKVTVLLNRRGVVSFEQLLLDISEALGFPRWHRARVTRLYTTHAREVKGICDFFRGEVAFLALGKARPELSSVQEALEELFPDHSHYQAEALRAWEKRLRPPPDKASKADSGYSEGTDGSGTHNNQEAQQNIKTQTKNHTNTHTQHPADTHHPENLYPQKSHKKNSHRKPAYPPNHLQRLHVKGGVIERPLSVIGPFKHQEDLRDTVIPSPTLCENCLARRAKYQGLERMNPLTGRVPLPPVARKQIENSLTEQKARQLDVHLSPPPLNPVKREEYKSPRDVTLSDIERCYEFGRVVGDGNFAVVRECRRRDNGETLAMKIIERSKLIGREHMMQNELSLLGSLCHARIVRLYAHHHTQTHSYLVMEFVSGGDLFEAITDKGKFSEAEAGMMVSDVSEALSYIHCKSIVHRDLKPENLLIERVAAGICRLKLGDFGLAMVVTEPVFTICGTPTYVAPEILSETGYGVPVDVWALGVILYILLCGFPPFRSRDRDQEELFQLIKQAQLHFLSPYWDPISEEARQLVRALLQPDPTIRMTAEQALLHPWVKAMASICRQRAVTDKAQRNTTAAGTESERVQKPVQTNAAETPTDKRAGLKGSEAALSNNAELRGHDEKQTEIKQVDQPSETQPTGKSTVHSTEDTPGQQTPESNPMDCGSPSREVVQDEGPKLSNCDTVSPTSPGGESHQQSGTTSQTELPSQQLDQIHKASADSTPHTHIQPQPTTQQPPSDPAAPSSSTHSLHQQNSTLNNSNTVTDQKTASTLFNADRKEDNSTTDATASHSPA